MAIKKSLTYELRLCFTYFRKYKTFKNVIIQMKLQMNISEKNKGSTFLKR